MHTHETQNTTTRTALNRSPSPALPSTPITYQHPSHSSPNNARIHINHCTRIQHRTHDGTHALRKRILSTHRLANLRTMSRDRLLFPPVHENRPPSSLRNLLRTQIRPHPQASPDTSPTQTTQVPSVTIRYGAMGEVQTILPNIHRPPLHHHRRAER
jgi:hypothetical protein